MAATWLLWLLVQSSSPEADPQEALRERTRAVRLELEAARSGEFYLVVSPTSAKLELKLRGVTLETAPFGSIDVGLRVGSDSKGEALTPLFACRNPAPPAPEIQPGEVVSVEPPPEPAPRPFSLECEPQLEIRFVPTSSPGSLTALRDRFGGAGESPIRVIVTMEDAGATRLAAVLPPTLRVLFSWAEVP